MKTKCNSIVFLFTLVLGFALFGCKKDSQETLTPKITDDKVEVTATTATFTWTVDWPGKLMSVVEVSENEDMSNSRYYGSEEETENHDFTVTVSNLERVTKYYYRYIVWNKYFVDNKFILEMKNYYTVAEVPVVYTGEVSVCSSSATVSGEVVDECGADVTERGICWHTSPNPTIDNHKDSDGMGLGMYLAEMTGLLSDEIYYVRAYAINSAGVAYGEEISFIVPWISKPTVGNYVEMSNITCDKGELHYSIYDDGVFNDGSTQIIDHGICWSTSHNPTISGNHISYGNGAEGSYNGIMEGLAANTTYYVRAYATNCVGTGYGVEISFTTYPVGSNTAPEGAVNGRFTVNALGCQVWFSKGNLQYQANNNKWRFAENQWDFVGGTGTWGDAYGTVSGSSNNDFSSNYNGWIDLFGWGTSGWNCGNTYYRPSDIASSVNENYDTLYGPQKSSNLTGWCVKSDWGVYNAIENGGNQAGLWRTLTNDEWMYVIDNRNTPSGIRFAKARVEGISGIILLPDDWIASYYSLNDYNSKDVSFGSNIITASQWDSLELHGAVFLPETGWRRWDDFIDGGGYYWTASAYLSEWGWGYSSGGAYSIVFGDYFIRSDTWSRSYGISVRLVCSAL